MLQNFVFQGKEDNQNLMGQFALFYFYLHHASLTSSALTTIKFGKKIKIPFQCIMNHFHLRNDSLESHEIASKKKQDTLAGIN